MTEQRPDGGRHRVRLDRRGQLAGILLGFVAGGMAVNLLADDYRYRGLTIATAAGAVLATASWLRRLPAQAALPRYATRLLLLAALPVLLLAGRQRAELRGHRQAVWSVAIAPDGSWLATSGQDSVVRVWDAGTGRQRPS